MLGLFDRKEQPASSLAVTSLDARDWKEDAEEASARKTIQLRLKMHDPAGNTALLRKYYPLRVRLRKFDAVLGFQAGTVLKFARVKRTAERFPIEVFFSGKTATGAERTVTVSYDSTDAELLGPA